MKMIMMLNEPMKNSYPSSKTFLSFLQPRVVINT
jgi:hypothetical protein